MLRRWLSTTAFVVAALGLQPSGAHAQDEIKVGAFLPVTGATADVGAQIRAGIEVAVERINQAGVQLDKPYKVHVLWYDTEGKGDVGLNVVKRALTLDDIDIGVGFLSSDVFTRVMDEFQQARVPVVDCCAASVKIGDKVAKERMTYVFQLSPTADDIARSVSAAVTQAIKPAKIALLNENTDSGRDFSRVTREWFKANQPSVEIVADDFVDRGVNDLTPQLAKVRRTGAQAIIGEIYGSSAPVLYQQWYELKVPAVIAHMGATVAAESFIDQYKTQMEGSIVNNRWWPAPYSPISEPMMEAYKKKTNSAPTNFAVQGHDAALVAIEAVRIAKSLDPDKVSQALEATAFETAWGERKFTSLEQGHRMPIDTVVVQIQGGKKVPIYPAAVAESVDGSFKPVPPYAWDQ